MRQSHVTYLLEHRRGELDGHPSSGAPPLGDGVEHDPSHRRSKSGIIEKIGTVYNKVGSRQVSVKKTRMREKHIRKILKNIFEYDFWV